MPSQLLLPQLNTAAAVLTARAAPAALLLQKLAYLLLTFTIVTIGLQVADVSWGIYLNDAVRQAFSSAAARLRQQCTCAQLSGANDPEAAALSETSRLRQLAYTLRRIAEGLMRTAWDVMVLLVQPLMLRNKLCGF